MTTCLTTDNPVGVEALFTGGISPQVRMGQLSSLRSVGYTQLVLTGALRQAMTQHFCDPQNIMNARLRDYLRREGAWQEGQDTGIYIEWLGRWRPELTERRPAIIVREGDWQLSRKVIGDIADTDWRLGITTHLAWWEGTHTLFAMGGEPAETQILGIEIARLLTWFSGVFAEQLCLDMFRLVSIGALSAVKESKENYVVPVTVAYTASETWNLQLEAPRLKRIVLEFDAADLGLRAT